MTTDLGTLLLRVDMLTDNYHRKSAVIKEDVKRMESRVIAPKVNAKELHALNRLYDKKIAHHDEVVNHVKTNPIVPQVDPRNLLAGINQIRAFSAELERVKSEIGAMGGEVGTTVQQNVTVDFGRLDTRMAYEIRSLHNEMSKDFGKVVDAIVGLKPSLISRVASFGFKALTAPVRLAAGATNAVLGATAGNFIEGIFNQAGFSFANSVTSGVFKKHGKKAQGLVDNFFGQLVDAGGRGLTTISEVTTGRRAEEAVGTFFDAIAKSLGAGLDPEASSRKLRNVFLDLLDRYSRTQVEPSHPDYVPMVDMVTQSILDFQKRFPIEVNNLLFRVLQAVNVPFNIAADMKMIDYRRMASKIASDVYVDTSGNIQRRSVSDPNFAPRGDLGPEYNKAVESFEFTLREITKNFEKLKTAQNIWMVSHGFATESGYGSRKTVEQFRPFADQNTVLLPLMNNYTDKERGVGNAGSMLVPLLRQLLPKGLSEALLNDSLVSTLYNAEILTRFQMTGGNPDQIAMLAVNKLLSSNFPDATRTMLGFSGGGAVVAEAADASRQAGIPTKALAIGYSPAQMHPAKANHPDNLYLTHMADTATLPLTTSVPPAYVMGALQKSMPQMAAMMGLRFIQQGDRTIELPAIKSNTDGHNVPLYLGNPAVQARAREFVPGFVGGIDYDPGQFPWSVRKDPQFARVMRAQEESGVSAIFAREAGGLVKMMGSKQDITREAGLAGQFFDLEETLSRLQSDYLNIATDQVHPKMIEFVRENFSGMVEHMSRLESFVNGWLIDKTTIKADAMPLYEAALPGVVTEIKDLGQTENRLIKEKSAAEAKGDTAEANRLAADLKLTQDRKKALVKQVVEFNEEIDKAIKSTDWGKSTVDAGEYVAAVLDRIAERLLTTVYGMAQDTFNAMPQRDRIRVAAVLNKRSEDDPKIQKGLEAIRQEQGETIEDPTFAEWSFYQKGDPSRYKYSMTGLIKVYQEMAADIKDQAGKQLIQDYLQYLKAVQAAIINYADYNVPIPDEILRSSKEVFVTGAKAVSDYIPKVTIQESFGKTTSALQPLSAEDVKKIAELNKQIDEFNVANPDRQVERFDSNEMRVIGQGQYSRALVSPTTGKVVKYAAQGDIEALKPAGEVAKEAVAFLNDFLGSPEFVRAITNLIPYLFPPKMDVGQSPDELYADEIDFLKNKVTEALTHGVADQQFQGFQIVDLVKGKTLSGMILDLDAKDKDGLEGQIKDIQKALIKLGASLNAVNRAGVGHRDMHISNAMMDESGDLIAIDFGKAEDIAYFDDRGKILENYNRAVTRSISIIKSLYEKKRLGSAEYEALEKAFGKNFEMLESLIRLGYNDPLLTPRQYTEFERSAVNNARPVMEQRRNSFPAEFAQQLPGQAVLQNINVPPELIEYAEYLQATIKQEGRPKPSATGKQSTLGDLGRQFPDGVNWLMLTREQQSIIQKSAEQVAKRLNKNSFGAKVKDYYDELIKTEEAALAPLLTGNVPSFLKDPAQKYIATIKRFSEKIGRSISDRNYEVDARDVIDFLDVLQNIKIEVPQSSYDEVAHLEHLLDVAAKDRDRQIQENPENRQRVAVGDDAWKRPKPLSAVMESGYAQEQAVMPVDTDLLSVLVDLGGETNDLLKAILAQLTSGGGGGGTTAVTGNGGPGGGGDPQTELVPAGGGGPSPTSSPAGALSFNRFTASELATGINMAAFKSIDSVRRFVGEMLKLEDAIISKLPWGRQGLAALKALAGGLAIGAGMAEVGVLDDYILLMQAVFQDVFTKIAEQGTDVLVQNIADDASRAINLFRDIAGTALQPDATGPLAGIRNQLTGFQLEVIQSLLDMVEDTTQDAAAVVELTLRGLGQIAGQVSGQTAGGVAAVLGAAGAGAAVGGAIESAVETVEVRPLLTAPAEGERVPLPVLGAKGNPRAYSDPAAVPDYFYGQRSTYKDIKARLAEGNVPEDELIEMMTRNRIGNASVRGLLGVWEKRPAEVPPLLNMDDKTFSAAPIQNIRNAAGLFKKQMISMLDLIGEDLQAETVGVLFNLFKAAGGQLDEGLGDGIAGYAGKPIDEQRKLARRLIAEFRALLKISSPSKVYEIFGRQIVEGLDKGLEGFTGTLEEKRELLENYVKSFIELIYSFDKKGGDSQRGQFFKSIFDAGLKDVEGAQRKEHVTAILGEMPMLVTKDASEMEGAGGTYRAAVNTVTLGNGQGNIVHTLLHELTHFLQHLSLPMPYEGAIPPPNEDTALSRYGKRVATDDPRVIEGVDFSAGRKGEKDIPSFVRKAIEDGLLSEAEWIESQRADLANRVSIETEAYRNGYGGEAEFFRRGGFWLADAPQKANEIRAEKIVRGLGKPLEFDDPSSAPLVAIAQEMDEEIAMIAVEKLDSMLDAIRALVRKDLSLDSITPLVPENDDVRNLYQAYVGALSPNLKDALPKRGIDIEGLLGISSAGANQEAPLYLSHWTNNGVPGILKEGILDTGTLRERGLSHRSVNNEREAFGDYVAYAVPTFTDKQYAFSYQGENEVLIDPQAVKDRTTFLTYDSGGGTGLRKGEKPLPLSEFTRETADSVKMGYPEAQIKGGVRKDEIIGINFGDLAQRYEWEGQELIRLITATLSAGIPVFGKNAEKLGGQLGEGLAKGIYSTDQIAELAAINSALSLIEAVKKAYGIKSPSTVFIAIGKQNVAGEIEGIKQATPALLEAYRQLGEKAKEQYAFVIGLNESGGIGSVGIAEKAAVADNPSLTNAADYKGVLSSITGVSGDLSVAILEELAKQFVGLPSNLTGVVEDYGAVNAGAVLKGNQAIGDVRQLNESFADIDPSSVQFDVVAQGTLKALASLQQSKDLGVATGAAPLTLRSATEQYRDPLSALAVNLSSRETQQALLKTYVRLGRDAALVFAYNFDGTVKSLGIRFDVSDMFDFSAIAQSLSDFQPDTYQLLTQAIRSDFDKARPLLSVYGGAVDSDPVPALRAPEPINIPQPIGYLPPALPDLSAPQPLLLPMRELEPDRPLPALTTAQHPTEKKRQLLARQKRNAALLASRSDYTDPWNDYYIPSMAELSLGLTYPEPRRAVEQPEQQRPRFPYLYNTEAPPRSVTMEQLSAVEWLAGSPDYTPTMPAPQAQPISASVREELLQAQSELQSVRQGLGLYGRVKTAAQNLMTSLAGVIDQATEWVQAAAVPDVPQAVMPEVLPPEARPAQASDPIRTIEVEAVRIQSKAPASVASNTSRERGGALVHPGSLLPGWRPAQEQQRKPVAVPASVVGDPWDDEVEFDISFGVSDKEFQALLDEFDGETIDIDFNVSDDELNAFLGELENEEVNVDAVLNASGWDFDNLPPLPGDWDDTPLPPITPPAGATSTTTPTSVANPRSGFAAWSRSVSAAAAAGGGGSGTTPPKAAAASPAPGSPGGSGAGSSSTATPSSVTTDVEDRRRVMEKAFDAIVEAIRNLDPRAIKTFLDAINGAMDALDGVAAESGEIVQGLGRAFEAFGDQHPTLRRMANVIKEVGLGVLFWLGWQGVDQILVDFGRAAIDAALKMERFKVALSYDTSTGGMAGLERIRNMADDIGANFLAVADSYTKLTIAAANTNLAPQVERITTGFTKALTAQGATPDEQMRAFLAVEQMIGKNQIMAEELRQQLAEVMPQVPGALARSRGVTQQQLVREMKNTPIMPEEALLPLAMQLEAEATVPLATYQEGPLPKIAAVQNQVVQLQAGFGETLLSVGNGVEVFGNNIGLLSTATAALKGLNAVIGPVSMAGLTLATVYGVQALAGLTAFATGTRVVTLLVKAMGLEFLTQNQVLTWWNKNMFMMQVSSGSAMAGIMGLSSALGVLALKMLPLVGIAATFKLVGEVYKSNNTELKKLADQAEKTLKALKDLGDYTPKDKQEERDKNRQNPLLSDNLFAQAISILTPARLLKTDFSRPFWGSFDVADAMGDRRTWTENNAINTDANQSSRIMKQGDEMYSRVQSVMNSDAINQITKDLSANQLERMRVETALQNVPLTDPSGRSYDIYQREISKLAEERARIVENLGVTQAATQAQIESLEQVYDFYSGERSPLSGDAREAKLAEVSQKISEQNLILKVLNDAAAGINVNTRSIKAATAYLQASVANALKFTERQAAQVEAGAIGRYVNQPGRSGLDDFELGYIRQVISEQKASSDVTSTSSAREQLKSIIASTKDFEEGLSAVLGLKPLSDTPQVKAYLSGDGDPFTAIESLDQAQLAKLRETATDGAQAQMYDNMIAYLDAVDAFNNAQSAYLNAAEQRVRAEQQRLIYLRNAQRSITASNTSTKITASFNAGRIGEPELAYLNAVAQAKDAKIKLDDDLKELDFGKTDKVAAQEEVAKSRAAYQAAEQQVIQAQRSMQDAIRGQAISVEDYNQAVYDNTVSFTRQVQDYQWEVEDSYRSMVKGVRDLQESWADLMFGLESKLLDARNDLAAAQENLAKSQRRLAVEQISPFSESYAKKAATIIADYLDALDGNGAEARSLDKQQREIGKEYVDTLRNIRNEVEKQMEAEIERNRTLIRLNQKYMDLVASVDKAIREIQRRAEELKINLTRNAPGLLNQMDAPNQRPGNIPSAGFNKPAYPQVSGAPVIYAQPTASGSPSLPAPPPSPLSLPGGSLPTVTGQPTTGIAPNPNDPPFIRGGAAVEPQLRQSAAPATNLFELTSKYGGNAEDFGDMASPPAPKPQAPVLNNTSRREWTAPTPVSTQGGLSLPQGYGSLQGLAGQLRRNKYFDGDKPTDHAALALSLLVGGTEAFGKGTQRTDWFTRMGGTGSRMKGFGQADTRYHASQVATPEGYMDWFGSMMHGQRRMPNSKSTVNAAGLLANAVTSGDIGSGQELIRFVKQLGFGGSNWQGIDDGWQRVPGLADAILDWLKKMLAPGMNRAEGKLNFALPSSSIEVGRLASGVTDMQAPLLMAQRKPRALQDGPVIPAISNPNSPEFIERTKPENQNQPLPQLARPRQIEEPLKNYPLNVPREQAPTPTIPVRPVQTTPVTGRSTTMFPAIDPKAIYELPTEEIDKSRIKFQPKPIIAPIPSAGAFQSPGEFGTQDDRPAKNTAAQIRDTQQATVATNRQALAVKAEQIFTEFENSVANLMFEFQSAARGRTREIRDNKFQMTQMTIDSKGFQTGADQILLAGEEVKKKFLQIRDAAEERQATIGKQLGEDALKIKEFEALIASGKTKEGKPLTEQELAAMNSLLSATKAHSEELRSQATELDAQTNYMLGLADATRAATMEEMRRQKVLEGQQAYANKATEFYQTRYDVGAQDDWGIGTFINPAPVIKARMDAEAALAELRKKQQDNILTPDAFAQMSKFQEQINGLNIKRSFVEAIPGLQAFSSELKSAILESNSLGDSLKKVLNVVLGMILEQGAIKPFQNLIAEWVGPMLGFEDASTYPVATTMGAGYAGKNAQVVPPQPAVEAVNNIVPYTAVLGETTTATQTLATTITDASFSQEGATATFTGALYQATQAVVAFAGALQTASATSVVSSTSGGGLGGILGTALSVGSSIFGAPADFTGGTNFAIDQSVSLPTFADGVDDLKLPTLANGTDSFHPLLAGVNQAFNKELGLSGKKPYLAVLHEGEAVLSTRNKDAELYRDLKSNGHWEQLKKQKVEVNTFAFGTPTPTRNFTQQATQTSGEVSHNYYSTTTINVQKPNDIGLTARQVERQNRLNAERSLR